jgi:ATP-dependent Zn protease
LKKYLEKVPHSLDISAIANMTVGFNGASLAALVNEAALLSLRQKDIQVTQEHFEQVKDKVVFGKKKLQILSEKQKKYRITYQAAKVLVATYFDIPFEKLILSNERLTPATNDPFIKSELEDRVKMLLAGTVACNIKYNEHSSSAKKDLEEAKELVEKMIYEYSMGEHIYPKDGEKEAVIDKLYSQTAKLISSLASVSQKIESELYEFESISKQSVKEYIDEVL